MLNPGGLARLAVCVVVLCGAPSFAASQELETATSPLSDLGLEIFRAVSQATAEPNVVFSPVSVALATSLLAEGALAETRAEFLQALGVDSAEWDAFGASVGRFLEDVASDTTAVSRIATSLWVDEGRELAREFRSRAEQYHRASVTEVDLQDPGTRTLVDDWAHDQTEGRISKAMPPARPDMRLLLLNAVYFKGLWKEPFDSANTRRLPFLASNGDSVVVPTMYRTGRYGYFETAGASGVRMPYAGDRFAAYVVLPARSSSIDELERQLAVAQVNSWASVARSTRVSLFVPRFTHRGTWDLLNPLRHVGIRRALSPAGSQLDGLWARPDPDQVTYLTDATQGTFIQFDEKGTEAAAVTAFGVVVTSVPPPPLEFRVDRPFLLVLRDEGSGAILFVARIGNPSDEGG